jgi:hypothetical protein
VVIPPPAQSTESDRAWTALSWLQEPARSRRQFQCNLGDAVSWSHGTRVYAVEWVKMKDYVQKRDLY